MGAASYAPTVAPAVAVEATAVLRDRQADDILGLQVGASVRKHDHGVHVTILRGKMESRGAILRRPYDTPIAQSHDVVDRAHHTTPQPRNPVPPSDQLQSDSRAWPHSLSTEATHGRC